MANLLMQIHVSESWDKGAYDTTALAHRLASTGRVTVNGCSRNESSGLFRDFLLELEKFQSTGETD